HQIMLSPHSTNYHESNDNHHYAKIPTSVTEDESKHMAQADYHWFGLVTDFNEVSGSAISSTDATIQSYTYNVSRNQRSKTYTLTLTLQKDPNGNWDITSYGNDLGPNTPTCK